MNPLQQIPNRVRKWVYLAFALAGVVLGALQVGYGSADVAQPTWLDVAFDVLGYLVIALGLTAASNLPSYEDVVEGDAPAPPRGEVGESVVYLIAGVLLVVILAVVLLRLV